MKRTVLVCILIFVLGTSTSAQGGTKEELQRLQNDVLALTNQIRLLDKSFTEQVESLKTMVHQLAQSFDKSNALLAQMTTTLENHAATGRTDSQTMIREIRGLTTKLDDAGTRISALATQMNEMKVQARDLSTRRFQSLGTSSETPSLSADAVFTEAFNDLVQGNYDLAIQGFNSFVLSFPTNEKADDAQYYVGEAYYNDSKHIEAVAAFTKVINDFGKGDKVASAYYKRAKAELLLQERDNAVEDFKVVITRFKDSPEAGLARAELESLGIDPSKLERTGTSRRRP